MENREYSLLDKLLIGVDQGLRTVHAPAIRNRPTPPDHTADHDVSHPEAGMTDAERDFSGRLMRINHAGEVSAQGLYQGQALTARSSRVRDQMQRNSDEEVDHLAWCEERLQELDTGKSLLAPLWFMGSLTIGGLAGMIGDRWSLGFVRETERQVELHLDNHLHRLPPGDGKSRAILEQMKIDERRHARVAGQVGARELPIPIRKLMQVTSKVMTRTAFWI